MSATEQSLANQLTARGFEVTRVKTLGCGFAVTVPGADAAYRLADATRATSVYNGVTGDWEVVGFERQGK